MELIGQYNTREIRVRNSIQTNGTLLTAEWCRFLARYGFGVGISIDGPAFMHDSQRVNWAGRGSHRGTMRGLQLLREHDISPGVICVLTRDSLAYPADVFTFFLDNDIELLCFNLEEVEHMNTESSFSTAVGDQRDAIAREYHAFAASVFDLWRPHSKRMVIREFRDMLSALHYVRTDPTYASQPFETVDLAIVTVQKNGDITTFSPEFAGAHSLIYENFVVGNVVVSGLDAIEHNLTFHRLRADVAEGVRNCRQSCDYFAVCGGGFTSNKYFENGSVTSTETTTCRLHRQELASVVLDKLASR